MTALANFLMALGGVAAGCVLCGFRNTIPSVRSTIALLVLAIAALVGVAALTVGAPRPDCYHPRDVQAVWLDGAWRCITTEQAG